MKETPARILALYEAARLLREAVHHDPRLVATGPDAEVLTIANYMEARADAMTREMHAAEVAARKGEG